MASSSVSQEDHDVEHDFAMASRRAKVRSARANRALNTYTTTNSNTRGEIRHTFVQTVFNDFRLIFHVICGFM